MNPTARPVVGLTLNYRDSTRTRRCVQSMLDEGVTHVLVWDNSADHGRSAEELRRSLNNNPRVSIKVSDTNLGFAAGINRGARWVLDHFDGHWVLILNNDAYLMSGAVTDLVGALRDNSQSVIAYPDIDNAGITRGTGYYHRATGLLSWTPLPGSFPYGSGCCQLIAIDRTTLPIFDERFFMYGEDWAQGWMLGEASMTHVAKTLVFHEGNQSSGLGSEFYENRMVAAHWLLALRVARTPTERALLISMRLFTLGARALIRAIRFRSAVPLQALTQGWRIAIQQVDRNISR